MRVAIATFRRHLGERRVEIDTERRSVCVAFYVPRLGRGPVVDHETRIVEAELDQHIAALVEAREQLRALPSPAAPVPPRAA